MELTIRTENGNRVTYNSVVSVDIVRGGDAARLIEALTDYSNTTVDENHHYLQIGVENIVDGTPKVETATYRASHTEVLSKFEAVVTVSNWEDGSGWQYTNEVIERYEADPDDIFWVSNEPDSWEWAWLCEVYQNDGYQIRDGEDDEYTVTYYAVDEDGDKEEIASYSIWMSDIIEYMESLEEDETEEEPRAWKVYSNACRSSHPVQDVSFKEQEVLDEAIMWQYDEFVEHGGGVLAGNSELADLVKREIEFDYDSDLIPPDAYEACADELCKFYDEEGYLPAGDWAIVRTENGEEPGRPNNW